MTCAINESDQYWRGPFDIRIHSCVKSVPDVDGVNEWYYYGDDYGVYMVSVTNKCDECDYKELTKEQYIEKYKVITFNGFLYWNVVEMNETNN
jgi:hypothetical protein